MQHFGYGDRVVLAAFEALKVSANKVGTKVLPSSICSWNGNNPVSTPSRLLGNTWPRIATSKVMIRL